MLLVMGEQKGSEELRIVKGAHILAALQQVSYSTAFSLCCLSPAFAPSLIMAMLVNDLPCFSIGYLPCQSLVSPLLLLEEED